MVAAISACQTVPHAPTATPSPAPVEDQVVLSQLDAYVKLASQLAAADSIGRDALYTLVSQNYADAPGETSKLYLALVLNTAGHAHTNMPRADQLLTELEAVSDQLPPVTASLVRVQRALFGLTRALHSQLGLLTLENKHFRRELEDVESKIKALTAIEQELEAPSIRTKPPTVKR